MEIVMVCDGAYARSAAITLRSILASSRPRTVYIVANDLSARSVVDLQAMGPMVRVVAIPDDIRVWLEQFNLHGDQHVSAAAFVKLRMHDILPDVRKAIYLDSDLLVARDLKPLFDINLADALVGATWNIKQAARGAVRLNLDGDYFNSGVMVCPFDRWRREAVSSRFLEWYEINRGSMRFNDQEILNGVFDGRVKWIGKLWNVSHFEVFSEESKEGLCVSAKDCRIIHFNGPYKPWNPDYIKRPSLTASGFRDVQRFMQKTLNQRAT